MPSSGAGGPCSHCARTQSCCWRRGPASKPVLCNACGSRYLVKKSLEGYKPLQQRGFSATEPRQPRVARPKLGVSQAACAGVGKPKRAIIKTLDPATWHSEQHSSDDSEGAYLTDDSGAAAAPSSAGYYESAPAPRAPHRRSLLGDAAPSGRALRISTEAQLQGLDPGVISQLLGPSLRLKPRKRRPTISLVF